MAKRVVVVIVEGDSDETIVMELLQERYQGLEIKFDIVRGDIFFNTGLRNMNIKKEISERIKIYVKKRKYKESDILSILHIMDTDGCFIPKDSVVLRPNAVTKIVYDEDEIAAQRPTDQDFILRRNASKSRNVNIMWSANKVLSDKYKYQLYFFSRNLEHVVFDDPNPNGDGKCDRIDDFIDDLEMDLATFLMEYMIDCGDVDYEEAYVESWKNIKHSNNSLKRKTNVPLAIRYLDKLVE